MKITREAEVFRPVTMVIESQKEMNELCAALALASRETLDPGMEGFCDMLIMDLKEKK
jgi:hypothetical protein